MEKLHDLFKLIRYSFVGEWFNAGLHGLPIMIVAVVMYLVPAILVLNLMGYGEDTFRNQIFWIWAGAACGYYWGHSEGKRKAKLHQDKA